ncbi:MAG: hypothetical protein WA125_13140 [Desulfosporosinus sp.]
MRLKEKTHRKFVEFFEKIRRVRNQEMAIALLQDLLAEIEDKMRKRLFPSIC